MPKTKLKKTIAAEQDNLCALTDEPLDTNVALIDTDRVQPKAQGGTYTRPNTRIVEPLAHMERHGTLRERWAALDNLKSLFDDRVQMMKLLLKENNQVLAYERRVDNVHPETLAFLKAHLRPVHQRIEQIDKSLTFAINNYPDPLAMAAMRVKGLGPITVSALTVYINLGGHYHAEERAVKDGTKHVGDEKAPYASSLWKYVGLHAASHERYVKGEAGGGNRTLRTVLWNSANVMMKMKNNGYRDVYDRTKARLAVSEKIVKSRNTEGKWVEVAWKDTKPSHRHGAALRAIMKHLLADYWMVGRTLAGLPTAPLYVQSVLGHTHIISPRDRGWDF